MVTTHGTITISNVMCTVEIIIKKIKICPKRQEKKEI